MELSPQIRHVRHQRGRQNPYEKIYNIYFLISGFSVGGGCASFTAEGVYCTLAPNILKSHKKRFAFRWAVCFTSPQSPEEKDFHNICTKLSELLDARS